MPRACCYEQCFAIDLDDSDGELPEIKDVGKVKNAIKRVMQFRFNRDDNIALFKEIENAVPFSGKKLQRWEIIRDNLLLRLWLV